MLPCALQLYKQRSSDRHRWLPGRKVTNRKPSSWSWLPACLQNDAGLAALAADVASKLLGAEAYEPLAEPSMAAEDFSFYAQSVPAVFTFLGSGGTSPPGVGLHNPKFTLDEGVLPQGAALHAALAVEWVEQQSAARGANKDEL